MDRYGRGLVIKTIFTKYLIGETYMWNRVVWLGMSKEQIRKAGVLHGDMNGRFVYYRCEVVITEEASLQIAITANSRYRLWVNEQPVLSGPCKGDRHRHYYEEVDITNYLVKGKNVFAVQVLFCNPDNIVTQEDERTPLLAVASYPAEHRLAMEGDIRNKAGECIATVTTGQASWRIFLDNSFYLKAKEINVNLGAICEDIDLRKVPSHWKVKDFNDKQWWEPFVIETVLPTEFEENVGFYRKLRIEERPIPLLYEKDEVLSKELNKSKFGGNDRLVIPPHTKEIILFEQEAIVNAYMKYGFDMGKNAKVSFTYFEKFTHPDRKIKRTDYLNGKIEGLTDEVILSGESSIYEPFWVRTFRFICVEIETNEEELVFHRPTMRKTGYPLNPQSYIKSSESWVEQVWKMCVNTLQNCMLETYMDCPFYEQMQFIMDTRLQALFHYTVSTDKRLAKKALEDFHCSMIPDGLMQGKYPSSFPQIISTFSLHFIYMLYDYYLETGDLATVKRYRADVDNILEYYDRKIGESGLVGKLGYWAFVDWQSEWKESYGTPLATLSGPSTIINLMYGYALQCAAVLSRSTGRSGMEEEYLDRRKNITNLIQELCWNEEKGLYQEGPLLQQYSQHAQAWAILNGMVSKEQGIEILTRSIATPKVIQCSFSTSYELFRAMEQTGQYGQTKQFINRWIGLLEQDCTTCPEEPVNGRSENHAWSALPMFELIRCISGIRRKDVGWKSFEICPHMEYLPDVEGQVVTPGGMVSFRYWKMDGHVNYWMHVPEGLEGSFVYSDGRREILKTGENNFKE